MEAKKNPTDAGLVTDYQKRNTAVLQKLVDKMGTNVNAHEVKELVGEYDFVAKQLYQMDDVAVLMREFAASYQTNETIQKVQDSIYGEGTTVYIEQAI